MPIFVPGALKPKRGELYPELHLTFNSKGRTYMINGTVDRRTFVGSLVAAVSTSAIAATSARADGHGDACRAVTAEMQQAMTPDDAINALKAGNARFVIGESANCDLMVQVGRADTPQQRVAAHTY
jgi:hypothetical protein